jgi:hypothetical protein
MILSTSWHALIKQTHESTDKHVTLAALPLYTTLFPTLGDDAGYPAMIRSHLTSDDTIVYRHHGALWIWQH